MIQPNVFFENKNVLVTGGFGFVGSHLVKKLLDFKSNVTVLDIDVAMERNSLLNENSGALRQQIQIENGDVADFAFVQEIINKKEFHFVFHFAAYASVIEKAVDNPYETIQSNTLGLVNLLEAIRLADYTPDTIFFSSTDKVYGEMGNEPYEEEKTPLRGIGVYDSAKLAADVFARTYNEVYGIPTIVLRMCNLFGPSDFNTDFRLIPKAMKNIYGNEVPEPPELYFDALGHWREYLFIDDAIRAILLLACKSQCKGEVFNLLGCTYISTPDMLKTLVDIVVEVEKDEDEILAETIKKNGITMKVGPENRRVVTINKQCINGEKIKNAIEFTPDFSCREGLKQTVLFYRGFFSKKILTSHEERYNFQ